MVLMLSLALFAMLFVFHPAHAYIAAAPAALVGGLSALCGASIGFGVVAALALAAGTGGFGAALGVSAAIHIAALAC